MCYFAVLPSVHMVPVDTKQLVGLKDKKCSLKAGVMCEEQKNEQRQDIFMTWQSF